MKANIYEEIWTDVLPYIIDVLMDGKASGFVDLSDDKDWFYEVGDRPHSGYGFRLVFCEGEVESISNSAVARDLRNVLLLSSSFRKIAVEKRIIFRMGTQFILKIDIEK